MPRNFDLVRSGAADIAVGNHGVISGRFGVTQITDIPFEEPTDAVAMSVGLWRTHERFLSKANEHEGAVLLALHTSGSMELFSRDKPIRNKADMTGMKWLAPTNIGAQALKKLGAVPVVKPAPEFYETISKGIVDAMLATNTSVAGWKAEEFIKHQTRVPGGIMYATFFVVMNKTKFDLLEKRDQKILLLLSGEAYARRAGQVFKEQDETTIAARRTRVQIIDATPEFQRDIAKAFDFVEDEWLKKAASVGIDGEAALKYFRREVLSLGPKK
jgi:TRAP-type C4-dicarboxylate transport system substrate-binding protein